MHDRSKSLASDLSQFVRDPDADELDAALLVGRALADEFDAPRCRSLAEALAVDCPAGSDPWCYLEQLGFGGHPGEFDLLLHSRLDRVLADRRGIPISLGVLLIHVARCAGRAAVGINFPGHFLVRVGSQLVGPLLMGATTEERVLSGLRQQRQESASDDLFSEASPPMILIRMLNNVKYQYARDAEWDRALDMLDCQLQVQPRNPQLFLERGELWTQLGSVGAAREAYERVVELADDAQLRAAAQARLSGLVGMDTIH